jgi:undecaprenyl phosphate N,N'-diacetylbacillosamine 1-phosphate transferase
MFEKDVEYVEHITFLGDLKILAMTVKVALKPEHVAEDTNAAEGNFAEIRKAQQPKTNIEK